MSKKIYTFAVAAFLTACGASQDENPGMCSLDCSGANILGGDPTKYQILPLGEGDPATEWACNAAGELAVTYQYKVVETTSGDIGYDPNQPGQGQVSNYGGGPIPLSGVLVGVQTSGGLNESLATDVTQLCSDSCGVVTFQLNLTCPAAGASEGAFSVVSGAISTPPTVVTVTNDAAAFAIWENEISFKPMY